MDIMQFIPIFDFAENPTKQNLIKVHEFISDYPLDKLKINYPIFINCLLVQIRNLSLCFKDCIAELLYLLEVMSDINNSKIMMIVLEDVSMFIHLFVSKKPNKVSNNEFDIFEFHLAQNCIKIFKLIFSKIQSNNDERLLYSPSGLLALGYIVSFLLHFVECSKEREMQTDALSTLSYITDCESSCLIDKANVVVNLAPGIFSSLIKVIEADRKIGSSIKTMALRSFGNLVLLICGKKSYKEGRNKLSVPDRHKLSQFVVERTDEWKKKTWKNLHSMIRLANYSILDRSEEEHWKVRLELATISFRILKECDCVNTTSVDIVNSLIILSADSDSTVRKIATDALKDITKMTFVVSVFWDNSEENASRVEQTGVVLLSSVVRENIESVIDSMCNMATILSDDGKCNILQTLYGYLNIYDCHKLGSLSCLHLQQILLHLTALCAIDHKQIDLLETAHPIDSGPCPSSTEINCELINKSFVHFYNHRVFEMVGSVIRTIVRIVDPHQLFSVLHSLLEENRSTLLPVLLLSRLAIFSVGDTETLSIADKIAVCRSVLTTYFDPEILHLVTINDTSVEESSPPWRKPVAAITHTNTPMKVVTSPSSSHLSPSNLKQNSLTVALVMELCAACAVCVIKCGTPEDAESWLMRTCLFEVMAKAQQSPQIVRHSAFQTVRIFSLVHRKYERSIPMLVNLNADYIIDAVSRRLRAGAISLKSSGSGDPSLLARLGSTCHCMMTLCQHADASVLPFLSMVLDQVLFCLDSTHGEGHVVFLPVLREIVRAIIRWSQASLRPILAITATYERADRSNVDLVRSFLVSRHRTLVSMGLRKEDLPDEDQEHKEAEEGQEKQEDEPFLPETVVVVRKVLDRCLHLCSSPRARVRLLCLQVLEEAVRALEGHPDCLNQAVHHLWPPLEHRFSDGAFPVVLQAFQLLNCISQLSGGFLLTKIRGSLLSRLCGLLVDCARCSLSPTSVARHTGLFKLQSGLLHFLSRLCVRTGVRGAALEDVVDAFLPYLDDRQPQELTQACLASLRILLDHDPGLVWCKVAQILPGEDRPPVYGRLVRPYGHHFSSHAASFLGLPHP